MNKSDSERIRAMGHRKFVGGEGVLWDQIARLQMDYLISQGLKPTNTLMDIACGSLRAGRLFINYLDAGNYLGIDKEINLIIHGVSEELGISVFNDKTPEFVVSGTFEFDKFSRQPDFAIAQSLLTHLTSEDICLCFKSLRDYIVGDCKFYTTFFEVDHPVENYSQSDAIDCFFYTREQMESFANNTGWHMEYIGEWGHPRQQMMLKMTPK